MVKKMNQKTRIFKRMWKCAVCGMDVLYVEEHDEIICLCGNSKPIRKLNLNDARIWVKIKIPNNSRIQKIIEKMVT